jgi:hypothetical protein
MLDGRAYQELLALARAGVTYDGGDQGVLNALLSRPAAWDSGELDPRDNVFVNDGNFVSGVLDRLRPRVLHFTGATKPWSASPGWEYRHDALFREAWRALAASDDPAPLSAGFSAFCQRARSSGTSDAMPVIDGPAACPASAGAVRPR